MTGRGGNAARSRGSGDAPRPRRGGAALARVHHTTQNGAQFKTYALFISAIFNIIVQTTVDYGVTEITESQTVGKGVLLCTFKVDVIEGYTDF